MVVMADEKKLLLQEKKWIAAGSNYFSRNFGWPLRGVGGNLNGQNLNGQMLLKSSEIECQ